MVVAIATALFDRSLAGNDASRACTAGQPMFRWRWGCAAKRSVRVLTRRSPCATVSSLVVGIWLPLETAVRCRRDAGEDDQARAHPLPPDDADHLSSSQTPDNKGAGGRHFLV